MISQTALDHFRTSLATKQNDPYSVLLRRNKLPMALLDDAANPNLRKVRKSRLPHRTHEDQCTLACSSQRSHILETETFKDTFGPKAQRKKPRIDVGTFEELGKASAAAAEEADNNAQGADGESGTSPWL